MRLETTSGRMPASGVRVGSTNPLRSYSLRRVGPRGVMMSLLPDDGGLSPDLDVVFDEARSRLAGLDFDLGFALPDGRFFAIVGIVCVEENEQHNGFGEPGARRNGDGVMKRIIVRTGICASASVNRIPIRRWALLEVKSSLML